MPAEIAFAIPGDLSARTGGYIYDARLIDGLEALGRRVRALPLGDGFPHPDAGAAEAALAALAAAAPDTALLVDGLAYGALPTDGLDRVRAPIFALVHHPLALETGLTAERAATLAALERANLARARRVIVTSAETGRLLARDFSVAERRISVALPGIDRPPPGAAAPATPPLILAVGSLIPRKGHDVLLAALAQVRDLDWRAEIVGAARDMATAEALRGQCAALDLSGRVVFAGEIDGAALQARYAAASLFTLASRYEGYGMAFAEAMAHGLPVVACDAGAVADTVPAAAGILTPPDDPAAFAAALRALLTDPGRRARLAAGARGAAERLPRWSETARIVDAAIAAGMAEPAA